MLKKKKKKSIEALSSSTLLASDLVARRIIDGREGVTVSDTISISLLVYMQKDLQLYTSSLVACW